MHVTITVTVTAFRSHKRKGRDSECSLVCLMGLFIGVRPGMGCESCDVGRALGVLVGAESCLFHLLFCPMCCVLVQAWTRSQQAPYVPASTVMLTGLSSSHKGETCMVMLWSIQSCYGIDFLSCDVMRCCSCVRYSALCCTTSELLSQPLYCPHRTAFLQPQRYLCTARWRQDCCPGCCVPARAAVTRTSRHCRQHTDGCGADSICKRSLDAAPDRKAWPQGRLHQHRWDRQ